jgi:tRNA G26 N,N-dimethylase Trm1
MRKKEKLDDKILEILKMQLTKFFNLSEIARSLDRSLPTIALVIDGMKDEGKFVYENKKSMILIKHLVV